MGHILFYEAQQYFGIFLGGLLLLLLLGERRPGSGTHHPPTLDLGKSEEQIIVVPIAQYVVHGLKKQMG